MSSLQHYGVKGMKWGVRNSDGSSAKPKKLTRTEVKAERAAFYKNRADTILKEALDNPQTLIAAKVPGAFPSVMTGRQFVDYLTSGGIIDVKYTYVYAKLNDDTGSYERVASKAERYKRSDGR